LLKIINYRGHKAWVVYLFLNNKVAKGFLKTKYPAASCGRVPAI